MANIKFQGAVYSCSGYAQLRHLILALSKCGHTIKIVPFKTKDNVNFTNQSEFKKLEETNLLKPYINIISGIAPQIRIDPEASYNIAYSMFETLTVPDNWIKFYNEFNEIWVPSKFCKKAFDRHDLESIVNVISLGTDTKKYISKKRDKGFFTFLSVGKWIDRKGWDLLINAYTSEFIGNYDVRLCIKTDEGHKTNQELVKEYLTNDRTSIMPKIMIRNQKIDEDIMPKLYQESDCYVLPTRGEAFGLPYLEAMSSGVPCIASDFGGQTDFVNNDNGWLIKIKTLKHLSERLCKINSAYKGLWFAEPEIDDIRALMRYAYSHKDEAREKGILARKNVKERYDWKFITKKADKRLKEIYTSLNRK